MVDHFRDGSATPANDRRPAGERLDHHETEWFRPIDRKDQRGRVPEERVPVSIGDFPHELDEPGGLPQQGRDPREAPSGISQVLLGPLSGQRSYPEGMSERVVTSSDGRASRVCTDVGVLLCSCRGARRRWHSRLGPAGHASLRGIARCSGMSAWTRACTLRSFSGTLWVSCRAIVRRQHNRLLQHRRAGDGTARPSTAATVSRVIGSVGVGFSY